MLTQDRLMYFLSYNPDTGEFTRLRRQPGTRPGAVAGSRKSDGYLVTSVDGKLYMCHRLAWLYMTGSWPKHQIDHIDGNRSNNSFSNLRDVTKTTNAQNQRRPHRSNKSTEVLGTFKNGSGYAARISHNGSKKYLGTFKTIEEASAAYIAAKRLLHSGCTI